MDCAANFRLLGTVDIGTLKHQLNELIEADWHQNDFRQRQYDAHHQTQTIPLLFDTDNRYANPTRQPAFALFENTLKPILAAISSQLESEHYLLRLLLTRLPAGAHIAPHKDKGSTLHFVHRIHLPVITHHDIIFCVDNERKHMAEGEIWEINNCRIHGVVNRSAADRVHLIMDWVTPTLARQYLQQRFQTVIT